MRTTACLVMAAIAALSLSQRLAAATDAGPEHFWPQWRGPLATGEAPHADPPSSWSENENVRWKVQIPGLGHSTPIVWGETVFVQTTVETDRKTGGPGPDAGSDSHGRRGPPSRRAEFVHRYVLIAVSRTDGRILWEKELAQGLPHERVHADGSWASASPVTDGRHVFAFFGSMGLHCLTFGGERVWSRDFGRMQVKMQFGEGASPVLHGDRIIVQWDHEGPSFIASLDKATGKDVWRVQRDEVTSWSTPVVTRVDGKLQILTNASRAIRAYDFDSGKIAWQCSGMTLNVVPSPVAGGGLAHFASGFRGTALLAVRLSGASGDVSGTPWVAWDRPGDTPYVPTPLLHDGKIYCLKVNEAVLTCLDAATGSDKFRARKLEGLRGAYASPVCASGRIYVTGRNGATAVISAGHGAELIGINRLDGEFSASCAPVGNEMIMRSHKALYCIASK